MRINSEIDQLNKNPIFYYEIYIILPKSSQRFNITDANHPS